MQDAFNNPPATVHDVCVAVVKRFGSDFDALPQDEQKLWREATSFISMCVAGRFSAVIPDSEMCRPGRRASDCAASLLHAELVKVMQEAHFVSQRFSGKKPATTN